MCLCCIKFFVTHIISQHTFNKWSTVFISKYDICYFNSVHVDFPFSYFYIILLPCSNVNNLLFIEGSVESHFAYPQCKTDIENYHSKRSKHIVKSLLTNLLQSLIASPIITETHRQCCVVLQGVQSSYIVCVQHVGNHCSSWRSWRDLGYTCCFKG